MAKIRDANVRRSEVDSVDDVAKAINDLYRICREQQSEINTLRDVLTEVLTKSPDQDEAQDQGVPA